MVFGQVNGPRRQKRFLFEDQFNTYQASRGPKPPRVQVLLKTAFQLKERLEMEPRPTQTALAKELGISRVRVTQILNLLRLAPEIQRYILTMPTTVKKGPIVENRLRDFEVLPKNWTVT